MFCAPPSTGVAKKLKERKVEKPSRAFVSALVLHKGFKRAVGKTPSSRLEEEGQLLETPDNVKFLPHFIENWQNNILLEGLKLKNIVHASKVSGVRRRGVSRWCLTVAC